MNCLLPRKGKSAKPKRRPQIIFRSGSVITGLRLVCFLTVQLHRSRKHDSVLVFPCPFRSGSAFVPSQKPSLVAGKSSLLLHALSLKQAELSCALTRHSHMSQFTDLLLYISNHFRTLGISVICCNWDINHSVQAK